MHKLPVYVINLKHEHRRRENALLELRKIGITPRLIDAHDGHDEHFPFHHFKDLSGNFWGRPLDFKPGAFACYLSHAECWRAVAGAEEPYGMIVEDDIEIDEKAFSEFALGDEIAGFDLIFINHRTHRLVAASRKGRRLAAVFARIGQFVRGGKGAMRKQFAPVGATLRQLIVDGKCVEKIPVPGADGYIVSRKGAVELLRMMRSRKVVMGVDFAMLFNSLTAQDVAAISAAETVRLPETLRFFLEYERRHFGPEGLTALNSYIYTPAALVRQKKFPSSIRHDTFKPNDLFRKGEA